MPYVESGEAAKIGTAIHALAEHCFKEQSDPMTFVGKEFQGITMTEENCDFAKQYLDAIFKIYNEHEWHCEGVVEEFLPYQNTPKVKVGGTADFIAISTSWRKLIIADLKTGRGYVDADSDQLKLYSLAALEGAFNGKKLYQDIDTVELWIIQPHHGEVRKHTMTTQELVDWEHYILQPAIDNALNPAFPPVPSDSACQYCAAKTICPAQANMVEVVHSAPPVEVLTEEQISVLLNKFDMVEDYIKAVKEHALKRMEQGAVIDGWQLAPKRALRSWTSEEKAIEHLTSLGLRIHEITKTELLTPAQVEKLLPKGLKESIEPLTSRISSGLTLARDKGLRQ